MLPLITSLFSRSEDPSWHDLPGVREVLLEHRALARTGSLDSATVPHIARQARARGLSPILAWDVPAGDDALAEGARLFGTIDRAHYDAVRVQDPGIAFFMKEQHTDCPLHLVLETGNHNLAGIQAWVREVAPRRVVLSNELPLCAIQSMRAALSVEIEIQVLGRILIFFSPRRLLAAAVDEEDTEERIDRFITSIEEGKHFPVVENRHGTLMYYEKELFLLPYLEAIEKAGVDAARLDLRFYQGEKTAPALRDYLTSPSPKNLAALKVCIGPKLTRGFFKSNRTDKQFVRLTNPHLKIQEAEDFLGTVLETQKGRYLAMVTEAPLHLGARVSFQTPEGARIDHEILWIRAAGGQKVTHAEPPGPWMVNPAPRVSSGAKTYFRRTT